MTADGYALRSGTPDDVDELLRVLSLAFSEEFPDDTLRTEKLIIEPERVILSVRGDEIAGVVGAYTRDLTVPGAVLPAAHVTLVGVSPAHRRRGLLRRMMLQQFGDIRAAGESVAVLWASEGRIYQRFGYGLAARKLFIEADHEVQVREPAPAAGHLRLAEPAKVTAELSRVYDLVRADRPGWSSRDERWWDHVLDDPASQRKNATSLRATVHETESGVDGYALWRVRQDPTGRFINTVSVREVAATTVDGYRALWDFLLNVDLTRKVDFWYGNPDEPLLYLVNEPRRLNAQLTDSLWVRLVDVPRALAGRRYPVPIDVTIEVTDHVLPENSGTWRLVGGPESARCTRVDSAADLVADVGALGAAYLGGSPLAALAAAGRVREVTPGTLALASTAFGWYRTPSATEVF